MKKLIKIIFAFFTLSMFFVFIGAKRTSFEVENKTNATKLITALIYVDDTATKHKVSLFESGNEEIGPGEKLVGFLNEYIHPLPFVNGSSCVNIEMIDKNSKLKKLLPCPKSGSLITLE